MVFKPLFTTFYVAKWRYMATQILINIGSDNGLLPNDTKPLPEPMLTYRKYGQWHLSKGNFTRDTSAIIHENQLQFA